MVDSFYLFFLREIKRKICRFENRLTKLEFTAKSELNEPEIDIKIFFFSTKNKNIF